MDRDANQDVRRRPLRIFGNDVEVPVVVERAGVEQFVFRRVLTPPPVFLDQISVRKHALWVFVERFEVRVGGCRVEIVVTLLDVLAVIAFAVGQPEQALLEDRVPPIPQRERETERQLVVADPEDPVFPPTVCTAASHVMTEGLPRRAALAVVLADRSPLALAQVRTPSFPSRGSGLVQAPFLFRQPSRMR